MPKKVRAASLGVPAGDTSFRACESCMSGSSW